MVAECGGGLIKEVSGGQFGHSFDLWITRETVKMYKNIIILALVSMVWGRPSYLHTSVVPYGYELDPTIVGHTLHSIPTAVSHQSQTIVHEKRPYLRPIIEHTPVLKAYAAPEIVSPYYDGWDGGYAGHGSLYGGWHQW